MNSSSEFTRLNGFQQASNGVFHGNDDEREFNYSDGAASEQQLRDILSSAGNLASDSAELASRITDWPTEYHLSPSRANLLRPLKLQGVERVLELGCGCGSITRFLAEVTDAQIDAIEGSPIRADLAALRCRDMPNVTISTANFNDVEFPEDYYDLILFVGVTEYAGRFSDRATDQEALQDLLALAQRAAKKDGVTLIAIENRIGLKYVMGACEDHYGVPNIGIENYPDSSGIRTYSRAEWLEQIGQAKFSTCKFIYPFPDYKVPTLLIHDQGVSDAADYLARIKSRDYVAPFDLGAGEADLWRTKVEEGTLSEFSNSFMILVGNDPYTISDMVDFEIAEYPATVPAYLQAQQEQQRQAAAMQESSATTQPKPGLLSRLRSLFR